jgi:transposase
MMPARFNARDRFIDTVGATLTCRLGPPGFEGLRGRVPHRRCGAMNRTGGSNEERDEERAAGRRSHADEIVLEALAEGMNYTAAAELANVSARTVRRRMTDPAFAALVSMRRGQRVAEVTGVLVGLAGRAVATLQDCLDAERPADRIKAAQVVLWELHRFRDQIDFEERLRQLEDAAAESDGGVGHE